MYVKLFQIYIEKYSIITPGNNLRMGKIYSREGRGSWVNCSEYDQEIWNVILDQ